MHFEWRKSANKVGCQHYCSKCKGEVDKFTKRVDKEGLQSLLADKVHSKDLLISNFVRIMKKHKTGIFHDEDVPKKKRLGKSTQCVCN